MLRTTVLVLSLVATGVAAQESATPEEDIILDPAGITGFVPLVAPAIGTLAAAAAAVASGSGGATPSTTTTTSTTSTN